MDEILFDRGPYDEILPPPLVAHLTFEEAWKEYMSFELLYKDTVPSDLFLEKLKGWTPDLIIHIHTWRIRQVIAGTAPNETPTETQLRARVNRGELLSLRPLGAEHAKPTTFAPVLKRLGETSWQFGLPGHGRVEILEEEVDNIIEEAQHLYLRWRVLENPQKFGLLPPEQNSGESE